ncbi:hypothetical protein LITTLEE_154 [Mycobacterium phage LittleE]|uniref:Uncharacterized protein n=2 Tax=Omegavirus TaxID=1623292 RepID=G1D439_9CAUD|nr:hypothetical protein FDG54_gp145 [Mycobacterium phage Optimus]YP_009637065.1 hypothetical protein FGG27_gp154 [Mycobacterium phage LittleE]AEJ92201.1 hypothetical protein OPTIMUS_145 [Mycobacterium phage Optimus]AEK09534.1 hypothetical protein LITTLEE_154 [Mycobacterium phage LittleE]
MIPRIGSRRWIAWKLVQLAARIHYAEYCERIYVTDPAGQEVVEVVVIGDPYGCGIFSTSGGLLPGGARALPDGSTIHWGDDCQPDW